MSSFQKGLLTEDKKPGIALRVCVCVHACVAGVCVCVCVCVCVYSDLIFRGVRSRTEPLSGTELYVGATSKAPNGSGGES